MTYGVSGDVVGGLRMVIMDEESSTRDNGYFASMSTKLSSVSVVLSPSTTTSTLTQCKVTRGVAKDNDCFAFVSTQMHNSKRVTLSNCCG